MACKERIHKLVDVQIAQKQMIMETWVEKENVLQGQAPRRYLNLNH